MEHLLPNILPFLGHNRDIRLVSTNWRDIIQSNDKDIIDAIQQEYPSITPASSVRNAFLDNNIDVIRMFVRESNNQYNIDWNYLFWDTPSAEMARIILPYIEERHRQYLINRFTLSSEDTISTNLRYLLLVGRKEDTLELIESSGIPQDFPWEHFNRDVLQYLRDNAIRLGDIERILFDIPALHEYFDTVQIISLDAWTIYSLHKESIKRYLLAQAPNFYKGRRYEDNSSQDIFHPSERIMEDIISDNKYILNLLSRYIRIVPRLLVDLILKYSTDKSTRLRTLLIAVKQQYRDIIAYHLQHEDVIPLLSNTSIGNIPRVATYIDAAIPGFYNILFSIFRGDYLEDPLLWNKLLASSLDANNMSLAEELIHVYHDRITEENIRNMYMILNSANHYQLTQILSIYFDYDL